MPSRPAVAEWLILGMALGLVISLPGAAQQMRASTDPTQGELKPERFHVSLSYGGAVRKHHQQEPGLDIAFGGLPALSQLHLAGAHYFSNWLGAAIDTSAEWFALDGERLGGLSARRWIVGIRAMGMAALRWSAAPWLRIVGHAGYAGGGWPVLVPRVGELTLGLATFHGPVLGVMVQLEPWEAFGVQLYGRLAPLVGGSVGGQSISSAFWLAAGAQLMMGRLSLGAVHGAFLLAYEANLALASTTSGSSLENLQHRLGLGLYVRYQARTEAADVLSRAEPVRPRVGPGGLRGRVLSSGQRVAGATIQVADQPPVRTGEDGRFELAPLGPGRLQIKTSADGYKTSVQEVEIPADSEAEVSIELLVPTGPGTIRGTVNSADPPGPLGSAEIAVEGVPRARTSADGTFVVENVGPGAVSVTIKAVHHLPVGDAVQVPAEGEARVAFTLLREGSRAPATVRGLIRAASGRALKATVTINELKLEVPVGADGRFVVQLPGGRYSLTIEAARHVAQKKVVEVADGDQAIFHCDLQPVMQ